MRDNFQEHPPPLPYIPASLTLIFIAPVSGAVPINIVG